MSDTQSDRPSRRAVIRDVSTFVGGWVILFWQMLAVPPDQVNETFLIIATALLGVPVGVEGAARILGGTQRSGPSSASGASSSPPSSSSGGSSP